MKKIILMVAIIGLGFTQKELITKKVETVSIKMELNAINETSKDLEKQNRALGNVPESKFEKLRADKKALTKRLRELQA